MEQVLDDRPAFSAEYDESVWLEEEEACAFSLLKSEAGDAAPAFPIMAVCAGDGNVRRLRDIEADYIYLALVRYDGHLGEVSRRLGIGRSTLYRKLQYLGIIAADSRRPQSH